MTLTHRQALRGWAAVSKSVSAARSFSVASHGTTRKRNVKCAPTGRRTLWGSAATAGTSPFAGSGAGHAAWESLDFLPQISPELFPLFFALLLAAREDDDDGATSNSTTMPDMRPYTVQAISSKGLGAVATTSLKRGEVVLTERPLLIWPTQLDAARAKELLDQLSPSAKKAYLSLANADDGDSKLDPILGIRATNGFNVELPSIPPSLIPAGVMPAKPTSASFIFPRIARLNHSCVPNADHSIDWTALKMTVYATTPIEAGDEICIEYMPALVQKSREERRQILKRDFGFWCQCSVCALQGDAATQSDQRRQEIDSLVKSLDSGSMKRKEMWDALGRIQDLLAAEGYKAMPEFSSPRLSDAYVGFINIKQQRESGIRE